MLTPDDISKKQILFISTNEDQLDTIKLQNSNIMIKSFAGKVRQMSIYRLLAVFILGDFTISSKILKELKSFCVSVYFLKQNCNLWGEIEAAAEGNYLVRQRQYTVSEAQEFVLAKAIILQKISNQVSLLHQKTGAKVDLRILKTRLKLELTKIKDKKALLGFEGTYSKKYFRIYFREHSWHSRKPQIKEDITNLLMDIGYTYLFNLVSAYLKLFGFDTYKGVYHTLFFQRKSLACDIMEPFRPLIDKEILKAYNLKQIDEKDFSFKNGSYSLSWKNQAKYSKIFLGMLVSQKSHIFRYIRDYYRYFMRPDKYKFPQTKI